MSVFAAQTAEFSKRFRVITIDSRGHGRSLAGGAKLSLYDMAEDVVSVMKAAGLEKANVLGFSDGGKFTSEFPAHTMSHAARLSVEPQPCPSRRGARGEGVRRVQRWRVCVRSRVQGSRVKRATGARAHG